MLPGLVDPFPNCYFLVCVFILPLMVIVFKLYLLKRNVVTFYPLTVVLIFYLCSLLGRDIALIMVQICRKESILLLLLLLDKQLHYKQCSVVFFPEDDLLTCKKSTKNKT